MNIQGVTTCDDDLDWALVRRKRSRRAAAINYRFR